MTLAEAMDNLRCRYRAPAWAFFEQVRDATGLGASRTADAVAFSLWPSQGLELIGFEVKASRHDWLREKKHPEKADLILGYCDRIFIVATEKDLIKPEEIPPLWGLIEPHGARLRPKKPAERNPHAAPLDRPFFASLMREAHRFIEREIADAASTKEAESRGRKRAEEEFGAAIEDTNRRRKDLERAIAAFEAASGVQISVWDAGHVGEAVKVALASRQAGFQDRLLRLREDLDQALTHFNGAPA